MRPILDAYIKLCLLRLAPQDLPASATLLGLSLLMYGGASLLAALVELRGAQAVMAALVDTGLLTLMTQLTLWIRNLGARLTQTLTALAGAGTVMTVISLPILIWQHAVGLPPQGSMMPTLTLLALLLWNLVVMGNILRHALSAPIFVGTLLAILYVYISISLFRSLFLTV